MVKGKKKEEKKKKEKKGTKQNKRRKEKKKKRELFKTRRPTQSKQEEEGLWEDLLVSTTTGIGIVGRSSARWALLWRVWFSLISCLQDKFVRSVFWRWGMLSRPRVPTLLTSSIPWRFQVFDDLMFICHFWNLSLF